MRYSHLFQMIIVYVLFAGIMLVFSGLYGQSLSSTVTEGEGGRWRITPAGGTTLFYGDIKKNSKDIMLVYGSDLRPNASLTIEYDLSPSFSLRTQAWFAEMSGVLRPRKQIDFETELLELNLGSAININNLFGQNRFDRFLNVNLFVGAGIANFNSRFYKQGTDILVSKSGFGTGPGIGGRTLDGVVLAGLGLDFRMSKHWTLRIESSNKVIVDNGFGFISNSFVYDLYNHTTVGFAYRFGSAGPRITRMAPDDPAMNPKNKGEVKKTPAELQEKPEIESLELDFRLLPSETDTDSSGLPKTNTSQEAFLQSIESLADLDYRVQIMAKFGNKMPVAQLAAKFKLSGVTIREDYHNGYYIYTVGSFSDYEPAAEYRNKMKDAHGVFDAFVVAFRGGKRLDKLP